MPSTSSLKDMKFAKSQTPCTPATVKRRLPVNIAIIAMLCALAGLARSARAEVFDGGVNSANLGKGEWIYILANAVNHLADSTCPTCRVTEVTDVSSMMAYFKTNLSLQYIEIGRAGGR